MPTQAGAEGRHEGVALMGPASEPLCGNQCCAMPCVAFDLQFCGVANGSDLPGCEAGAGAGRRAALAPLFPWSHFLPKTS